MEGDDTVAADGGDERLNLVTAGGVSLIIPFIEFAGFIAELSGDDIHDGQAHKDGAVAAVRGEERNGDGVVFRRVLINNHPSVNEWQ